MRERLDQIEDLPEELEALAEHLLAWLKQDGAWLGEPAIERWAEAHQVDLQDARRCLDWLVSLNDVNARGLGVCPQWRAA